MTIPFLLPSSGIFSKIISKFRKMENQKTPTSHLENSKEYIIDYFQVPKLNRNELQFLSPFRYNNERVPWTAILNLEKVITIRDYSEVYDEVLRTALDEVDNFMKEIVRKKLELYQDRNPDIRTYSKREKGIRFFSNVALKNIEILVDDYELRQGSAWKYLGRSTAMVFSSS